ncbi:hypothetical protein OC861_000340 [Tilletia horrida]|nr:hypothetical protein OC861_000340 [Tilletia horrida]
MSQRVDKGGPKFRPNVPIRRPQPPSSPGPGPSSSSSSQPLPQQPSSQPAATSQPTASTSAPASSSRPQSQQIVAAGLRLTQPIHAPGSSSSDSPASSSTSIARPRAPRLVPPPPPPPPPPAPAASTQPAQSQDQEQRRRRPITQTVQDDEQDGEDQDDEQAEEQQAKRRKGPRAKRLTIAEQEAAYEELLAQEGADLDESRPSAEDLSMADLAKHEVRLGKASKRTFEMMRKYEEHKQEQKDERQLLKEKLIRKRQAGKDWIDTFGSDEEEEAEQEKKRQLRQKRKERLKKQKQRSGETGEGDDEDEEEEDDDPAAVGQDAGDSDDGNSMTSEEGSDEEQGANGTASSRQKDRDKQTKKGKDKQGAAKNGKKKKQGKNAQRSNADGGGSSSSSAHSGSGSSSGSDSDDDDDVYGESSAAVQIRLGPDGRPVLSESSLTLDPSQLAETIDDGGVEGVTAVIETERFINSNTRGKRSVNARWNKDETEKFFRAISQWGTDFEMIARLFPTRSRHQIKLKFSREEKTNPERVNQAFKTRIPVDLEAYGVAVGRNLSGPPPQVSVKKPDDYLKMEQQERLLRAGGEPDDTSAIGVRALAPGASRKTDRRSVSVGRTDRRDGAAAEEDIVVEGASDDDPEDDRSVRSGSAGASRSSSRRSVTPSRRNRSGSNAGASGGAGTGRLTQRRAGGYDRERDRERARARAEEQRRERERLHRAGSGRGGGIAYESQEMVLGDADD